MSQQKPLKDTDYYETPQPLFNRWNEEFHFGLDVCATKETAKREYYFSLEEGANGLKQEWLNNNWCNPPYSDVSPWLRKAIKEIGWGNTTVCLLKSDTSTKWFHELVLPYAAEVRFLQGRIKFLLNGVPLKTPPPWGSMLVIFKPRGEGEQIKFTKERIQDD